MAETPLCEDSTRSQNRAAQKLGRVQSRFNTQLCGLDQPPCPDSIRGSIGSDSPWRGGRGAKFTRERNRKTPHSTSPVVEKEKKNNLTPSFLQPFPTHTHTHTHNNRCFKKGWISAGSSTHTLTLLAYSYIRST